jgi:gliding motility-associated-like protein
LNYERKYDLITFYCIFSYKRVTEKLGKKTSFCHLNSNCMEKKRPLPKTLKRDNTFVSLSYWRKGLTLTLLLIILVQQSFAHNVGDYKTISSGNWNDVNIWERWNGTTWIVSPAQGWPGQNESPILTTISLGHNVILNTNPPLPLTALAIEGALDLADHDLTLNQNTDITNTGAITNTGQYSGTITFKGPFFNNGNVNIQTANNADHIIFENSIGNNGTFSVGGATLQSGSVSINGTGTLYFNAHVKINGAITITNNAPVSIHGGTLNGTDPNSIWKNSGNSTLWYNMVTEPMLTGDLIADGVGNTVVYDGNNQNIAHAGPTGYYYNLSIENGGTKTISTNIEVGHTLTMTSGNILVEPGRVLTLGTNMINIGTLNYGSGTIIGAFSRFISTTSQNYLFPLGTASNYNPASLDINPSNAGRLTGEFKTSDPGISGLPLIDGGTTLNSTFKDGYWLFTNENAFSSNNFNIALTGDGFTDYIIGTNTRIVSRNSGNWGNSGTHVSVSGNTVTRNNLTNFTSTSTSFALATSCPNKNLSVSNPTTCSGQSVNIVLSNSQSGVQYQLRNDLDDTPIGSSQTGNGSDLNFSVAPTSNITYNILATYGGCSVELNNKATVTVNPLPTPVISGSNAVCPEAENIIYSIINNAGSTYEWTVVANGVIDGSNTSNSVLVDWNSTNNITGKIKVKETITATGCSKTTADYSVDIKDNTAPTITCPTNIADAKTSDDSPGDCSTTVSLGTPTTSDNCGIASVTAKVGGVDINPTTYKFPVGTTTVSWWVTDKSNNIASCSQAVTVSDDEKPVISGCPGDISVDNDPGNCSAVVSWTEPTATDNCTAQASLVWTKSHSPGNTFPVGNTVVTYTAKDAAGNISNTCSFTITVKDTEKPVISGCPGDISVDNDPGNCSAVVSWTEPTATDNCTAQASLVWTKSHSPGNTFPVGNTVITYTAKDAAGNISNTCSFTITVKDTEKPVISGCPGDISVDNDPGNCSAVVSWTEPTATDNCTAQASLVWTKSHSPGNTFPVGNTVVTYTAKDAAGNISNTCSFTITVKDTEKPVISGCPGDISVDNDPGNCSAVVSWTEPTATDNCTAQASLVWTKSHSPGNTFPVGNTVVTYTAKDAAGNISNTCSFTITVKDTEKPVISGCPGDISVDNDPGNCSAVVSWTEPTATDNCTAQASLVWTKSHTPGNTFPVGNTVVTYTAKDAAGNISNTCSFTITVKDTEKPVISGCPGDISVDNDPGNCSAVFSWAEPTATDNCTAQASLVWTKSHSPGNTFPVGNTVVTYTAKDAAGNISNTCSFTITVKDTEKPVISGCPGDISVDNDPGNCSAVVSWTEPTATDNCTAQASLVWTKSHSPGNTFPVGNTVVTYTAKDAAGNISNTCSFTITVKDTEKPVISGCPGDISVDNDPGNCSAVVSWTEPTATDNCTAQASLVWTKSHTPGNTFPVGNTVVTYTAKDAAGNISNTCSFTITVKDTEKPVISGCPGDISVDNDPGNCSAVVSWTEPTATDNCTAQASLVWTKSHTPGNTFPVGNTVVTYTATDAAGNISNTCSFTITVKDTEKPVISGCPGDISVDNDPGNCSAVVFWTEPTATDNCTAQASLVWTKSHSPGNTFPVGNTVVTYTATDATGNISNTCSFTITVKDTEKPVISGCPNNISVNTGPGRTSCNQAATWAEPSAVDNCSGSLTYFSRSHTPGSDFPVGTTTVTYIFKDAAGNESSCSFDVTVVDNTPPIFTVPADITLCRSLDCTYDASISITGDVTDETDNCSAGIDATSTDDLTNLPSCDSEGYIIRTWTLTDSKGNTTTKDQKIWIEPVPKVSVEFIVDTICDNTSTAIKLNTITNPVNRIKFRYTSVAVNSLLVTGNGSGSGLSNNQEIIETLDNKSNEKQKVTYTIVPYIVDNSNNEKCTGNQVTVDIWVEPTVKLNISAPDTIFCNNSPIAMSLNWGTTPTGTVVYDLTTIPSSPNITGYQVSSSKNTALAFTDNLSNNGNNYETVKYRFKGKIIHSSSSFVCNQGTDSTLTVYMNPTPVVNASLPVNSLNTRDSICYNEGTIINISTPNTSVIGTVKYDLTATYPAGVTGVVTGNKKDIANLTQNLVNTTNAPQLVTYTFTPVIVNVRPSPSTLECGSGTPKEIKVWVFPEVKYNLKDKKYGAYNIRCNGETNGSLKVIDLEGGWQTGGYSYTWSSSLDNKDSIINKPAGLYNVTVTDKLGCATQKSFTLTQPDKYTIGYTVNSVKCKGINTGSIDLSVAGANGNYTYNWTWDGQPNTWTTQDISNLFAGSYNVIITDANSCKDSAKSIYVQDAPNITWTHNKSQRGIYNISCKGANDGYLHPYFSDLVTPLIKEYNWWGPDGFTANTAWINNLKSGVYKLTVKDINDCYTIGETDTIKEPSPVAINPDILKYSNGYNLECHNGTNGTVSMSISGGHGLYQYVWSAISGSGFTQGVKDQNSLTAGQYIIEVKDYYTYWGTNYYACSYKDTFTLNEPPSLDVQSALSNYKGYAIDCKNNSTGTINITTSGGYGAYTYDWSKQGSSWTSSNEDQVNLSSGTYNLKVTYGGTCTKDYSFTLNEPSAVKLDSMMSNFNGQNISCYGSQDGYIHINPSGSLAPYSYQWSTTNGSPVIKSSKNQDNLKAGTYNLQIKDDNNCLFTWDLQLKQPDSLSITTQTEDIQCSGAGNGKIEAIVKGGTPDYSYLWSNGATTNIITNVSIIDYYLTVTDKNQCSKKIKAHVLAPDPLNIIMKTKNISCNGQNDGSIELQINGGRSPYTYEWNNGLTTPEINGLTPDKYGVKVTDWGGCIGEDSMEILEPESLTATYNKQDLLCNSQPTGRISLYPEGGTAPYYYMWSNGATTQTADRLKAGEYLAVVRDANNCPYNFSITLTEPTPIVVTKDFTRPFCPDTHDGIIKVSASGGTEPLNYKWNDGSNTQNLENIAAGKYIATIYDGNNCEIKDTTYLTPEKSGCVDIPTAFSPNGDGTNDTWDIRAGAPENPLNKVRDLYPNAIMQVFNRWGILIFKSSPGYTEDWDGTFKDSKMPVDSYYYIFDLRNGGKPLTGNVTIIR